MKSHISLSLSLILMSLPLSAQALVDYTEGASDSINKEARANRSSNKLSGVNSGSQSLIWKSDFSFNANYEAREIESEKIGVINLNTHLQTPFNIYFDVTYWNAQNEAGSQSGNPKAIIGFNWLRFGAPTEEAKLDIYGGAKNSGSSVLASSRTDKIFGAETTKRFGTFGLGIGFDMTLSGTPKKETDMSIGNIQRIALSGGWMVSNDIQFELEVENFKIKESSDLNRTNILKQDVRFITLSPKLNLSISQSVGVEMGARFRTKKPKNDQDLASAKLFDLHGAYSNSLFAGLNLSL